MTEVRFKILAVKQIRLSVVKHRVIKTTVSQIFLKILKLNYCFYYWFLICHRNFLVSKRRVWVMRESFLSKIHLSISLILLMRANLWLEKWVQWRKKSDVDSTKFLQLHKGFIASTKLCRNSCSLRWLKPTRNLQSWP